MTINSEVRAAGPFEGNGVATSFPFEFKVFADSEVLVVRELDGVELVLDLGTDYTVALNADQDSAPGGSVDLPVPLPVGYTLSMTSALAPLQPVDLTNQGGFYPRVINASLDRLTILVQQLSERLGRTLVAPISDGGSGFGDLPGKYVRKGAVLAFDEVTGAPIVGPRIADVNSVASASAAIAMVAGIVDEVVVAANNVADITNFADVYYGSSATDPTTRRDGSPLQTGDLYFNTSIDSLRSYSGTAWRGVPNGAITVQNLSGDGVKSEFLLNFAPDNEAATSVFISGIYQQKNTYELGGVGGSTIIFNAPPPVGADNIEVVVSALQPSDDKLRMELAAEGDPAKGAGLIGYKGRDLYGRLSEATHLTDFDGAIEGQGNSAALAFTQAEASAAKQIFVPQGTWNAGSVNLTKRYYGPGAVISNGATIGRDYVSVGTMPAGSVTPGFYYGADLSKVSPVEFIVQSSVDREDLDIPYFDYRLIPNHTKATFRSGQSGYDATITTPTIVGTNYVFVDDLTPFSVGDLVVIGSYLPNAERKTITLIEPGGKLTFNSNFASVIGTPGLNTIAAVSKSARTNSGVRLTELDVVGARVGGDFVAETMRISCGATHNPGRNHAFDRTTIGFFGGDAVAYTPGIYIAGTEFMYYDTGTPTGAPVSGNIMVIDQVRSFNRTVDDGTFGCVWLGSLYKSEGTLPANAAHVIAGKWKRGLDTVLADLGVDKAAVSMASTHRLYWGSLSQPDLDGFRLWGDLLGPIFLEGRTTGGDNLLEVNVGGVDVAKFRADSLNVKGNINALNNVGGATLTVPSGGRVNLGTNTYITYNGTNILLFKNGAQVASW